MRFRDHFGNHGTFLKAFRLPTIRCSFRFVNKWIIGFAQRMISTLGRWDAGTSTTCPSINPEMEQWDFSRYVRWGRGSDRIWLLGCPRKLGSMVRINGLFHLSINGVYWGYNPLILTFDPNFLAHPSRTLGLFWEVRQPTYSSSNIFYYPHLPNGNLTVLTYHRHQVTTRWNVRNVFSDSIWLLAGKSYLLTETENGFMEPKWWAQLRLAGHSQTAPLSF